MKTNTQTLAAALRILANDIESPDGVANAAIAEAAERLEELRAQVELLRGDMKYIKNKLEILSSAGLYVKRDIEKAYTRCQAAIEATPTQCLREIQADAVKSVIAECYDSSDRENPVRVFNSQIYLPKKLLDQYANCIRKRGE